MTQPTEALEVVYERLATAIDEAGPERAELYLAKLALRLAHDIGDPKLVLAAIEACLEDL
jgi:hypothetical protein